MAVLRDPRPRDRKHLRSPAEAVQVVLEARATRALLSLAIVISLVPQGVVPWQVFVALFSVEFLARAYVLAVSWRRKDAGPGAGGATLLLVDLLALLSFVPVPQAWEDARWLRLFRLSRMLLLAGYWAPLARDLWLVVTRRERAQQVVWMGVAVAILSFAGAVVLGQAGAEPVDFDEDGRIGPGDRSFLTLLWWAFRQIQDPGNMIAAPRALLAVGVSLALTVCGLFLVSFLIGMGTDVVRELLELGRTRPPGLRGHTVIANVDARVARLLQELFGFHRKSLLFGRGERYGGGPGQAPPWLRRWAPDYLVTGASEEPPSFLRKRTFSRVVYRPGTDREMEFFERVDGASARRFLLLADLERPDADARTVETAFFLASTLQSAGPPSAPPSLLLAEILDEGSLSAARAAWKGADRVRGFAVPTERLSGLFWASLVREPDAAAIWLELLSSRGREIYTVIFDAPALSVQVPCPTWLAGPPAAALEELGRRGRWGTDHPVLGIGLLYGTKQEVDFGRLRPYFGGVFEPAPGDTLRGIVVVADNVEASRRVVDARSAAAPVGRSPPEIEVGAAAPRRVDRVVVFGFRRSTAHMVADLLHAHPGTAVLVVVRPGVAGEVRRCLEGYDLACRLSEGEGIRARFRPAGGTAYTCDGDRGRVEVVEAGRWWDASFLADLPAGFGSVARADVVVLVAEPDGSADPQIVEATFKIATLAGASERAKTPLLLVEVSDAALAARLRRHMPRLEQGRPLRAQVHAYEELRSLFLFQSVVVPGFDAVYTQLFSAAGARLVRRPVRVRGHGPVRFDDLARAAAAGSEAGHVIAVEWEDGPDVAGTEAQAAPVTGDPIPSTARTEIAVAPGPGDARGFRVDADRIRAVWRIEPRSAPGGAAGDHLGP